MSRDAFVVTIDGPAGAGKSTTSRALAARLGFHYLDSGALYRAVAVAALDANVDPEDESAVVSLMRDLEVTPDGGRTFVDGRDVSDRLRTEEVSQAASCVSAWPGVRAALVSLQRAAVRTPGTVAEGRDMGTVIFPDADLKVFLHADAAERARRRTAELPAGRDSGALAGVEREMQQRDQRDSSRAVAPLKPAADAVVIDSTHLSMEEVVERIASEVERVRSRE